MTQSRDAPEGFSESRIGPTEDPERILGRARDAGAQLLRVERGEGGREGEASGFLLTFDVGRVWLTAGSGGAVVARFVPGPEDVPGPVEPADEEEPWWRLLGSPLARVGMEESALALQFRPDGDHPRRVRLACHAGRLAAALER